MQIKKTTILILIIAVSVIVSGCLPVRQTGVKKPAEDKVVNNEQSQNIQKDDLTEPSLENLPTWPEKKYTEENYEGWKTYINEKLGYKIKYPPTWTINACDEGCRSKEVIINPPDAEMFTSYISIALESRTIEGIRSIYLNPQNYGGIPHEEDSVVFTDKKAYHFFNGKNTDIERFIVQSNNKLFSINTQKNKNEKVIQALASFEFIE